MILITSPAATCIRPDREAYYCGVGFRLLNHLPHLLMVNLHMKPAPAIQLFRRICPRTYRIPMDANDLELLHWSVYVLALRQCYQQGIPHRRPEGTAPESVPMFPQTDRQDPWGRMIYRRYLLGETSHLDLKKSCL